MHKKLKIRFARVIMKISLFIYFSISIFFTNSLRAMDSEKDFQQALRDVGKQFEDFKYAADGIDPFTSSILLNKKDRSKADLFLDDPLRNMSLKNYKLLGLIWKTKVPKAFIQDTEGKTHVLRKGDYLGDKQGQIIKIREGEVIVLEAHEEEDEKGLRYKTNVLTFSELFLDSKKKKK